MTGLFDKTLFNNLLNKYLNGKLTKAANKINIPIIPPDEIVDFYPKKTSELYKYCYSLGSAAIKNNEFAVIIVNGGMATRFGNHIVKGIVEVLDNKSFLQLKLENIKFISQKFNAKINVFIMNSIFTDKPTKTHFIENNYFGYNKKYIHFINQYYFYRLTDTGKILRLKNQRYGCGHGDFFYVLKAEYENKILKNNIKYILYSNVDNLGATIDPFILGNHIKKKKSITIEIAKKNKGDKGGAPAIVNNKAQIVEEFKFPADFDQNKLKYFNTATYICSSEILEKNIDLPFYVVEKKVDNINVIQFERLAGDLSLFFYINLLLVNRKKRFLPIKTQDDLIAARQKLKTILQSQI